MTVPAEAGRELNMVFNNGADTWDNNNDNDYTVTVTDSEGNEPPPVFTVEPDPVIAGQGIHAHLRRKSCRCLAGEPHWGYNGWSNVTTTAMTRRDDQWTLTIQAPSDATEINFVFK